MNASTQRIKSIDILRGIVMIIMALDHTRDFYSNIRFDALDLNQTSVALFLTRWITHFCAPVFVFLSGTSAYLYLSKGKTKKQASVFLFTRGLWLIFIELAIINLSWSFDITYSFLGVQVIWAIGWSMIFLSALVYLKPVYIGLIGILIIGLHNSLDNIHAESFGKFKYLWSFLHEQNFYSYDNGNRFFGIIYPVIPWIGVIAAGFWFGTLYNMQAQKRKDILFRLGVFCLLLFVVLRYSNIYGDLNIWTKQPNWYFTLLSFINCSKYPPSLLFLLITLGIAFIVLALLENAENKLLHIALVYGKVPFFYYILHIVVIHASGIMVAAIMGTNTPVAFSNTETTWGFNLPGVYIAWILIVAALYLPCYWFMKLKQRRKDWWLSYL
jgi:uncharacterized membrane protein